MNENFTVRKISYGEGVERVFPLYSPMVDSIKLVRRGKVRRAKLYYLRGLRGKSARIAEGAHHGGQTADVAEAPKNELGLLDASKRPACPAFCLRAFEQRSRYLAAAFRGTANRSASRARLKPAAKPPSKNTSRLAA